MNPQLPTNKTQVVDFQLLIKNIYLNPAIPYMKKMTHFFVMLSAAKASECAKLPKKAAFH
jgi:hypothetical protein